MTEYRRERASFRFTYPAEYPEALTPRVFVHPDRSAVLEDWSETGLRIRVPWSATYALNDVVHLTLTPHAAEAIELEGFVTRVSGASISIRLTPPALPPEFMQSEQRNIREWQATTNATVEESEAKRPQAYRTIDELS